jgi:aryl-alcohol dehydrogenase-like predicted oxidoreductase
LAKDPEPTAADGARRIHRRYTSIRHRLPDYEALCAELGRTPADVALAWLRAQPGVTGPIIGPRTSEQLERSLDALEVELEPQVLDRLDAIFPGPGAAPEAYAW